MKNNKSNTIENAAYFIGYKLLNLIVPFFTSVYVARILLPEGVGKVALAQNLVTYFTLVASLGMPIYGTREISKVINDKDKYNKLFWELFWLNAISTTVCIISYYTICLSIPIYRSELALYCVVGLTLVLNFFSIDWLYQGRAEYKYISIRGSIIKLLSVIFLFLFVKDASDYVIFAAINVMIQGGNYFINMYGLRSRIQFKKYKLSLSAHWKPLFILFATNVAIEVYTLLDTTMLGIFNTDEVVAYYTYAMKTSKIMVVFLVTATSVLLPKLSSYYEEKKYELYNKMVEKALYFSLLASIPCAILIFLNSSDIVTLLYGESFSGSTNCLRILSFLNIPITISTFLGIQVLCSAGKEKSMLKAVLMGAILNVSLNLVLIPRFAHNGAAISSLISEITVAIVEFAMVYKLLSFKIQFRTIRDILLGATSIFAVYNVVCLFDSTMVGIVKMALRGTLGLLIYCGVNLHGIQNILGINLKQIIHKNSF